MTNGDSPGMQVVFEFQKGLSWITAGDVGDLCHQFYNHKARNFSFCLSFLPASSTYPFS